MTTPELDGSKILMAYILSQAVGNAFGLGITREEILTIVNTAINAAGSVNIGKVRTLIDEIIEQSQKVKEGGN